MPLLTDQINLLLEDAEFSEDELYYLSSKVQAGYYGGRFQERVQKWESDPARVQKSRTSFKSYPNCPEFGLEPDLRRFRELDFEKAVLARRSSRAMNGAAISFFELSNLFLLSLGMKEGGAWPKSASQMGPGRSRALPSAGGLYPLEAYVLARKVTGLPSGIYHFNVHKVSFTQIARHQKTFDLSTTWAQQGLFGEPAAIIYLTSVFDRSRAKYGPRSLRFIFLEAGGIGAQMNLVANSMGVEFCYDGGGFDGRIEKMLGIDGRQEGLITSFVLGHVESK